MKPNAITHPEAARAQGRLIVPDAEGVGDAVPSASRDRHETNRQRRGGTVPTRPETPWPVPVVLRVGPHRFYFHAGKATSRPTST